MISGLPGNMATTVAKYIAETEHFSLMSYGFTRAETTEEKFLIGENEIKLLKTNETDDISEIIKAK